MRFILVNSILLHISFAISQTLDGLYIEGTSTGHLIVHNLMQILHTNQIHSCQILFDSSNIDLVETYLKTIATHQKSFIWQLSQTASTDNGEMSSENKVKQVPEIMAEPLPMANAQKCWIFIFLSSFNFGHELQLQVHCRLGLVLIIDANETTANTSLHEFVHNIWNLAKPSDLLVLLHRKQRDCRALRFRPDMGLIQSSKPSENQLIYTPMSYMPAPQPFVVKFIVDRSNAFIVKDMAGDQNERLVGFNVWTSCLLAEMLGRRLQIESVELHVYIKDAKLKQFLREYPAIVSRSLLPMDRNPFTDERFNTLPKYDSKKNIRIINLR